MAGPNGESAVVLFRWHGRPLGWGAGRVSDGRLDAPQLVRQFLRDHAWSCALPVAERVVQAGRLVSLPDALSLLHTPPLIAATGPTVTVAVRSRTAASRLRPCLDSLLRLDYAPLDLVLIDSSEDRRQVEALVRERYPMIRYAGAPALGAARRAIEECRGDILAVIDGDAVVDPRWASALVHVFLADPDVMTVSGFVLPPSLPRPFRPTLPAGAPFCRQWARVRDDYGSVEGATERAIERSSSNVAYWRPGRASSSRYTRVWEPAALVRTRALVPITQPANGHRVARVVERHLDLADGVSAITDVPTYDSVRLHVAWNGEPVGIARIDHRGAAVSRLWIEDAIAQQLTASILDAGLCLGTQAVQALLTAALIRDVLPLWQTALRGSPVPSPVRPAA